MVKRESQEGVGIWLCIAEVPRTAQRQINIRSDAADRQRHAEGFINMSYLQWKRTGKK